MKAWPWLDWPQLLDILNYFWHKLVGLEQDFRNGAAGGSNPTSLWKKIPIVVLGRWRSLQSLAQLLRWCCWKRRRGLVGDIPRTSMNIHERDIVSTASISCPTFFSAANLTVVLCSSSSVFDWKRCTHFGCEGFQYMYLLPMWRFFLQPTHPTDDLSKPRWGWPWPKPKQLTCQIWYDSMSTMIPPTNIRKEPAPYRPPW